MGVCPLPLSFRRDQKNINAAAARPSTPIGMPTARPMMSPFDGESEGGGSEDVALSAPSVGEL